MLKVMLVEDDTNLREIYAERLRGEGYEIVAAKDGEEALALVIKEKPNLIITDIMMPKISGFDFLDILRSTPETRETKVVMMTALSQVEDKTRADKLGADRYLVKSQVTLEDVAKVVKEILEGGEDTSLGEATATSTTSTNPVTPTEPVTPTVAPAINPVSPTTPTDTSLVNNASLQSTSAVDSDNPTTLVTQSAATPSVASNTTTVADDTTNTADPVTDNSAKSEPSDTPATITELENLASNLTEQYSQKEDTAPEQSEVALTIEESAEVTNNPEEALAEVQKLTQESPTNTEAVEDSTKSEAPTSEVSEVAAEPDTETTDFLLQQGIKVEGDPDLLGETDTENQAKSFLETVKAHLGEESANQLKSTSDTSQQTETEATESQQTPTEPDTQSSTTNSTTPIISEVPVVMEEPPVNNSEVTDNTNSTDQSAENPANGTVNEDTNTVSGSNHQMTSMPPTTTQPNDPEPAFDPTAPLEHGQTSTPEAPIEQSSPETPGVHGKIIQPIGQQPDKPKLSLAELYQQELSKAQVNAPVYNPPTGSVINGPENS